MTNFTFISTYKNGDSYTLSDTVSYDDLPRHGLKTFQVKVDNDVIFTMHLEEDQKLIYRKRLALTPNGPSKTEPIIYLVGHRENNTQTINYICHWPDDHFEIHQAGAFKPDHPWFYSPQLRNYEQ